MRQKKQQLEHDPGETAQKILEKRIQDRQNARLGMQGTANEELQP